MEIKLGSPRVGDIGRLRPCCWVKNAGRFAKIQRTCDDMIKVNIELGRTRMSKMNYTWHAENCTEIKSTPPRLRGV